jgi:hypothetical protein
MRVYILLLFATLLTSSCYAQLNDSKYNFFTIKADTQKNENCENAQIFTVLVSNSKVEIINTSISSSFDSNVLIKVDKELPEGYHIVLLDKNEVVKQIIYQPEMILNSEYYIGIIFKKTIIAKLLLK